MNPSPIAERELARRESPWYSANVIDALVVAWCLVLAISWGSFEFGRHVQQQEHARAMALLTPVPARPALTQWKCDAQEKKEHTFACAQRKRSDITQQFTTATKGKL